MGSVVNVQNPSACFSMSTLGPLQKLSLTLLASGALITQLHTSGRIDTRILRAPHVGLGSLELRTLLCAAGTRDQQGKAKDLSHEASSSIECGR